MCVCLCVCVCVQLLQSYPALGDTTDCSVPGSFVPGILQARLLEWGAIAFSGLVAYAHQYKQIALESLEAQ